MVQGFGSARRLAVTLATAAVVVGTAASVLRLLSQPPAGPPRHRALRPALPVRDTTTSPVHHPFGPELCVVTSQGFDIRPSPRKADVFELEASGELDDELSPTDRLLALRHAAVVAT